MCEAIDRWIKIGKDEGLSQGLSQGLNQGLSQGRSEGENAERIRIIRKKLEKGMNLDEIAELLELPVEEVKQLISESK